MASTAFAAYMTVPVGVDFFAHFAAHIGYFVVFILLWPVIASRHNLFVSRRRDHLGALFFDTLQSVTITVVFTTFLIAFFTQLGMERAFVAWLGVCTFLGIGTFRLFLQLVLWSLRMRGFNKRYVLIIGANPRTRHLASILSGNPQFGYEMIGILEDEPDRTRMLEEFHLPNLGKFDALEQVLTRHVVDEVYIGLPVRSRYETIQSMAHLCEGAGVGVRMIADLFPLRLATSRFLKLQDLPILSLTTIPENQALIITQRVTDILVSGLLLLLVSPLFLMTAIAIKFDSQGPVFFGQERVGQNQRRFKMLKFRSMVANAEELRRKVEALNEKEGPIFKARNDPRLTRVGRFIRKYSIDELPQLWNVLRGEMSLVGPRPPLPHEVAQYSWNQRRRLSVKPGMTGLSQVKGRSELTFKETVDLDLTYIDQWSIFLVFRILLMTIPAVIRGRGAV
jgi:exopolysaccharide biosynthesis polyprenyl glycosylphosphotransferase